MTQQYTYNGDYEDLLDWIIDAFPPKAYMNEGFLSWLSDVKQKFRRDNKHFSDDIAEEMKQFWTDNNLGKLGKPDKVPEVRKRYTTYNRAIDLGSFTTKDAYDFNQDRPRASIRRELQELVREGKLQRISKGEYRIT